MSPRLALGNVVVLGGGRSGEREVSLESSAGIARALRSVAPPLGPSDVVEVELQRDGRWLVGGRSLEPARALLELPSDAVFVLGLHGGEGEDGTLQGFLASSRRSFTGSGVGASALCMDKRAARTVVAAAGLRVAPAEFITRRTWNERGACLARLRGLGSTWFVKPNDGGSSVATSRVTDPAQLESAVTQAFTSGERVLVEAEIAGVELSCGVIGASGSEARALPPIEIRPHDGRFFDYEEKYSAGGAHEICPPTSVDETACRALQSAAVTAFDVLGCEGYARIDFIVRPSGEAVFLEANTLPGFTARSLFPQEAAVAGLDYAQVCCELVAFARRRGPTE